MADAGEAGIGTNALAGEVATEPGAAAPETPVAPTPETTPVAPATPAEVESWTKALPDELRGMAENKGWESPADALKSYADLEKFNGAPADQLLKLPADLNDAEAMAEIYTRLGRPDSPEGYELPSAEDIQDGQTDLTGWFADQSFAAGLTKDQAVHLVGGFAEKMDALAAEAQQAVELQSQTDIRELQREWGPEYPANMQAAKQFALSADITPDEQSAIERGMGTKKFLSWMVSMGRRIGEHSVGGREETPTGSAFGMTPAAARDRIKSLQGDDAFWEKLNKQDPAATREWQNLFKISTQDGAGDGSTNIG